MESEVTVSGVISIVTGIISLLVFPYIFGPVGVVFGLVAYEHRVNKIGLWLSIISIAGALIWYA